MAQPTARKKPAGYATYAVCASLHDLLSRTRTALTLITKADILQRHRAKRYKQ